MHKIFLRILFGMSAIVAFISACNKEDSSKDSEAVVNEAAPQPFHGDSAYITNVCNAINAMMMESSLELHDENQQSFDGIWVEDSVVVLSVHSGKLLLDNVTKGIYAIVFPRIRERVLRMIVDQLNLRKYVLPTNFFVAIRQNKFKIKIRYWDESGEKLDIPLTYEDLPEPYKKTPNPLAKKVDSFDAVTIGNQVWMAENMNLDVKGGVCYEHNPEYCDQFGRLYDYERAATICPEGWHLPDSSEVEELYATVEKILSDEIAKNHELDSVIQRSYVVMTGIHEGDSVVWRKVHDIGRILTSSEITKQIPYKKAAGLGYLGFNMKSAGVAELFSNDGKEVERFGGQGEYACLWLSDSLDQYKKRLYVNFTRHQYEWAYSSAKCSVRCIQDTVKPRE